MFSPLLAPKRQANRSARTLQVFATVLLALCLVRIVTERRIEGHYQPAWRQATNSSHKEFCHFRAAAAAAAANNDENDKDKAESSQQRQSGESPWQCAPWIPPERRNVLFLHVEGWDDFYGENSRGAGEDYVTASLDYALGKLGFTVKRFQEDPSEQDWNTAHRIILGGTAEWRSAFANRSDLFCRARTLLYYGLWRGFQEYPHEPEEEKLYDIYHPRQVLSAFEERVNTFLGFFPHSLVTRSHHRQQNQQRRPERPEKHGLVLAKGSCAIVSHSPVLETLMREGDFVMHTTACGTDPPPDDDDDADDADEEQQRRRQEEWECCENLPHNETHFIRHGRIPPTEYDNLIQKMSFLMGVQSPFLQPSPLLGLAEGVAFLNPRVGGAALTDGALHSYPLFPPMNRPLEGENVEERHPDAQYAHQHDALAMLGFPYVYNVDLLDTQGVLRAALSSHRHRFASYVPWQYRPEAVVRRVCQMLEDDSFCSCPNPVFGMRPMTEFHHVDNEEKQENDASHINCHASSYVRV